MDLQNSSKKDKAFKKYEDALKNKLFIENREHVLREAFEFIKENDIKMSELKPLFVQAAKYRHAISGETWSGHGRPPRWYVEALVDGSVVLIEERC